MARAFSWLWCVAACVVSCGPAAPESLSRAPSRYAVDAQGALAAVAERITLRWPSGQPTGLLSDAALCASHAYLSTPPGDGIDVVDLDRGAWTGRIGRRGGGPGEFREVRDLAVDCARDRLYVVDGLLGVLTFERSSGRYLTTYARPASFSPSLSRQPLLSTDGSALYVPGVWPGGARNAYAAEPKERMYQDSMLMWRIDLTGGDDVRMVAPIDAGCFGDGATCVRMSLDRVGAGAWVIAQGGGTRAAVLSETDGAVIRVFDVRSPQFLRDDAVVVWGGGIEQSMAWGETNSVINGIYAYDDVVATVHSYSATRNWRPGDTVQFHVFMNLHTATGEGLVSDIRLPGLPVGRDFEHLLILDYGEAGRRADADQLDLVKIPIGLGAFPSAVRR